MRTAVLGIVVIAMACGRSGVELVDTLDGAEGDDTDDGIRGGSNGGGSGGSATGDDDIAGTSAGGSSTGGVGGSSAGRGLGGRGGTSAGGRGGRGGAGGMAGSGGRAEPPLDPGGPIPNCSADDPVIVPVKLVHWLYVEGRESAEHPDARYLVELTPEGPGSVVNLGPRGAFRGWSADGRFLAFSGTGQTNDIELFDFSQGELPVPVMVTPRSGSLVWSRSDGRYALLTSGTMLEPAQLFVVDATTGAEKLVELPGNFSVEAWSWDNRYIALAGDDGLLLVDTSGAELALELVYADDATEARWSPDSRYVAFQSIRYGGTDNRRLYSFDTHTGTLEILDDDRWTVELYYQWGRDTSLIVTRDRELTYFFDVSEQPVSPILFADHENEPGVGSVSPGGDCYVYEGYCDAANEMGLCLTALPPDPDQPSVLIARTNLLNWWPTWAGTGNQLLLEANREPWLINVEATYGGEFTRRLVTEGTNVEVVGSVLGWNPSGRSDWVAYVAGDPRLWNRLTGDTFQIEIDEPIVGSAWSRDGRWLVVEAGTTFGEHAYYAQEIREGEPGGFWRLSSPIPAQGSILWPFYLQP